MSITSPRQLKRVSDSLLLDQRRKYPARPNDELLTPYGHTFCVSRTKGATTDYFSLSRAIYVDAEEEGAPSSSHDIT